MSDLARAIGAPVPVKIGDTTYLCGPLTVGDFGTLQRHMETQLPDVLGDALAKAETVKDTKLQKLLVSEAIADHRRNKQISHEDAVNHSVRTFDGMAFMLWLGIEKHKPGAFTFESLLSVIQGMDMRQFQECILSASGLDDPKSPAPMTDGA